MQSERKFPFLSELSACTEEMKNKLDKWLINENVCSDWVHKTEAFWAKMDKYQDVTDEQRMKATLIWLDSIKNILDVKPVQNTCHLRHLRADAGPRTYLQVKNGITYKSRFE